MSSNNHATFIWSIADLLRGSFKKHQYGDIILPFTVLRRLDAVLAPTKPKVLEVVREAEAAEMPVRQIALEKQAAHPYSFYNASRWDFRTLLGDPDNLAANLTHYVRAFSEDVHDIFDRYKIEDRIVELDEHDLLFHVVQHFAKAELGPAQVPNEEMGHIFEELIRKFAEASNETAGEHFTPRDVVELMVDLLLTPDMERLRQPGVITQVYDPTAGTGGMLSVAEEHIHGMRESATVVLAGQEINPQSYAICKADMTVKGQQTEAIVLGDTLVHDGHAGRQFTYCLSNPPFGVDWKRQQQAVQREHTLRGFAGRFGAGLPAVSDGSMLFLQHLISKMRPAEDGRGGRAAIVLNGSPLFTGAAGSGPSNIRKWILEHDLLEAIVSLPTDMFYNTGIATYVWVLTTQKSPARAGKVQLIDGSKLGEKMRKSLGSKRVQLSKSDIELLVRAHGDFEHDGISKIFDNDDFFYRTITVERPLRLRWSLDIERLDAALATKVMSSKTMTKLGIDWPALRAVVEVDRVPPTDDRSVFVGALGDRLRRAGIGLPAKAHTALVAALAEAHPDAPVVTRPKGRPEPDPALRDTENVPWAESVDAYFEREVLPFWPDAWIDPAKTKVGAEIPFTRHFYEYVPPRPLEEIDRDLDEVLGRIRARLEQVRA